MEHIIRKRKKEDCDCVQKVITKAWQQTYRGIVNDDFLDSLSYTEKDRITHSLESFNENNNKYLVLEVANKIVGFVRYDKADDSKYIDYGEIIALYILNEYKGYGYGKELFEKAVLELKKLGYNKMIIGCLDKNPTNEFYKHMGGVLTSTRIFSRTGQNLQENVYSFNI